MLDYELFGNKTISWLLLLAFTVGGLIVARIQISVLRAIGNRIQGVLRPLAKALETPVLWAGFLLGLRLGIEPLSFPEQLAATVTLAITFLFVLLITWAMTRAYEAVHQHVFLPYAKREDTGIDLNLLNVGGLVVRALIWTLGIGSALNSAGFNVSAVLAGLGIGGLAIAMASQDTVANIFGGIIILAQRPFTIGQRIRVAGQDGWVQEVGLRTTRLRSWLGRDIFLPNKVFTDSSLENVDSQKCYFYEMRPRLAYGTTAEQVREAMDILRQIVIECEGTDDKSWVCLASVQDGLPEIEMWYAIDLWQPSDKERWPGEYDKKSSVFTFINLEMMARFAEAGIRFGVPVEGRFDTRDLARIPDREGPHASANP